MRYIDKLLHILWSTIKFILVLLIYLTIAFLITAVAIFGNISIDVVLQVILGIILTLIGLYGICKLRRIFEKSEIPKLFTILFGWIGPICACIIGISMILN